MTLVEELNSVLTRLQETHKKEPFAITFVVQNEGKNFTQIVVNSAGVSVLDLGILFGTLTQSLRGSVMTAAKSILDDNGAGAAMAFTSAFMAASQAEPQRTAESVVSVPE